MNNMQRCSVYPLRLSGEFPSCEFLEENKKIKLEDLVLDPTINVLPHTGIQH